MSETKNYTFETPQSNGGANILFVETENVPNRRRQKIISMSRHGISQEERIRLSQGETILQILDSYIPGLGQSDFFTK